MSVKSLNQYDVNEQTGIDMANARGASTVGVENVRDYLHRKWIGLSSC